MRIGPFVLQHSNTSLSSPAHGTVHRYQRWRRPAVWGGLGCTARVPEPSMCLVLSYRYGDGSAFGKFCAGICPDGNIKIAGFSSTERDILTGFKTEYILIVRSRNIERVRQRVCFNCQKSTHLRKKCFGQQMKNAAASPRTAVTF